MEIKSSRRTSSLVLGDLPAQKHKRHLKLRLKNATNAYISICLFHLYLLSFSVFNIIPGLFAAFLHSNQQRSPHPLLTIFQSQPGSKASPPSLIPGLQECNYVQRHPQSTSESLQLSISAARELWETPIITRHFSSGIMTMQMQICCKHFARPGCRETALYVVFSY